VSKRILIFTLALGIVMSLAMSGIAFADQQIVISWYPQNYYQPKSYPELAKVVESVVKGYEELHPNVKIVLVPTVPTNYTTWLNTQFAGGTEPVIAWNFYTTMWEQTGWWVPLNKYLDEPDPYAAPGQGREHWKDAFPDYLIQGLKSPDGTSYTIAFDWTETALVYNKAIFDKLHLSADWKTWGEFIDTLAKLKQAGYIPFGMQMSNTGWSLETWADAIVTSACFADQVPQMIMKSYENRSTSYNGYTWQALAPEEIVKAMYDGIYSPYNPRFVEFLNIMKQWSQYWPSGYNADIPLNSLFYSGKLAIMWIGSWQYNDLLLPSSKPPFSWGITYLPPFTNNEIPTLPEQFLDTSFRVGGPTGTGSYGITVKAEKEGIVNQAVDFLMYLSTPETMGKIMLTANMNIPMLKGVPLTPGMEQFEKVTAMPPVALGGPGSRFLTTYYNDYQTTIQQYLMGSIDMKTAQQKLQQIFDNNVKAFATQYNYSWYK
jgi:ABC-type glycerol-3-phosphate transport system substrate-binding protein